MTPAVASGSDVIGSGLGPISLSRGREARLSVATAPPDRRRPIINVMLHWATGRAKRAATLPHGRPAPSEANPRTTRMPATACLRQLGAIPAACPPARGRVVESPHRPGYVRAEYRRPRYRPCYGRRPPRRRCPCCGVLFPDCSRRLVRSNPCMMSIAPVLGLNR